MLKFLNDLLNEKNMCHFDEEIFDFKVEYENEKLLQYMDKLKEIIKEQRSILQKLYTKIEEFNKNTLTRDICTQTEIETENSNCWRTDNVSVEEIVKEVAEDAMKQTGFVYESTSGLYYDYNTGYYYNAELGLYYDGNSGIYYYYDKEKNSFQFHSQVKFPEVADNKLTEPTNNVCENPDARTKKRKDRHHLKTKKRTRVKKKDENSDIEEGECSEDSNVPSDISSEEDFEDNRKVDCDITIEDDDEMYTDYTDSSRKKSDQDEINKAWPPCMRIIVQETKVKNLQVGNLFIVTYDGGTLGREGDHSVLIPDVNISKYHAKFDFDNKDEAGNYTLTDLGSRNGTFLDGKRLSTALQESEPHPILHESIIRVGNTSLLCHIHDGRETCSDCEPGLLMFNKDEKRSAYTLDEKTAEQYKQQLKKLKKKFGVTSSFENTLNPEYKDRAEIRRKTVGSHDDSFKTEVACVTQPIKSTNKGFKMLSKMGWTEGESLGNKMDDSITEPILVQQRAEKVGLGYDKPVDAALNKSVKKKQDMWKKVQDRYKNLE